MPTPLPPAWRTVRWLVLVSILVVLVRLVGELAGWDPQLFGKEPGGFSLVGASWLIPLVGFVFGWIVTGKGRAPDRPGLALILHLTGLVVLIAGVIAISQNVDYPVVIGALAGLGLVCFLFAWRAWPELIRYTLLYALAVRLAVVAVTLVAFALGWDTHFVKVQAELGAIADSERLVRLVAAQVVFWIPGTVLAAGAVAAVASLIRGRRPDDAVDD
jgi:hypothetical protein